MATPQLENGHLRIANEIVDHLCRYRLSGQEWQILWVIIRKTYGWRKKMDRISKSQFAELTGIDRRKCSTILKRLEEKKVIIRGVPQKGDSRKAVTYGLNKDYRDWQVSPKKAIARPVHHEKGSKTAGITRDIPPGVAHKGDSKACTPRKRQ